MTIQQKTTKLNTYFDKQITACSLRGQRLQNDNRGDEATFEKIKANVYDIFRTILSVAVDIGKGDPAAVQRFFLQKAEQIPASWVAAYDKAKQHDDVIKMQIEQTKLDTISEIKAYFTQIMEEDQ